jgi:para-aminobenzoate synthetase/4-amino-4-deoxychorismate lyase
LSRDETVFNVAIRTLELQEHGDTQTGKMGIGSGIVIDSDPASERQECLLKAAFLTASNENAPKDFSLLESLLWNGDYPRLQLHLERLADSAEYFGFPCKRAEIQAALFAHADSLERRSPRKVRLLLPRDGAFEIESEILPDTGNAAEPVRLCISPHRTDARHRMLFHKTTHRPLYSKALKTAQAAGFDEVLFFNQQGELTEGAISNVWIEKGGRLLTPPIQCGLLAGVERRHLLATLPNATEQILTLDDLHHADAIYLSNAVRGLRRATLSVETFFN